MTFTQKVLCSPFRESGFYKLILFPLQLISSVPLNDHLYSSFLGIMFVLKPRLIIVELCLSSVCYAHRDFGLGLTHPGSRLTSTTLGILLI